MKNLTHAMLTTVAEYGFTFTTDICLSTHRLAVRSLGCYESNRIIFFLGESPTTIY